MRKGNPGIGGTEYCILLLSQMYKLFYPKEHISLYAAVSGRLPLTDEIIILPEGLHRLPEMAAERHTDILVVSGIDEGKPLPDTFFRQIEKHHVRTVIWGHNFYLRDYCDVLAGCTFVKANVFVGRQQYNRYIDHAVINKSTYIFNMYPQNGLIPRIGSDKKTVTYIGALVPSKGFHLLAKAWKNILEKVPDAQLHVIGCGKLYDRRQVLGFYGLAEKSYEDTFIPALSDQDGHLLPSVHFDGILGEEKKKIIALTSVGVVNPSGRTETFGISAIDFCAAGVPVVTIKRGGFLDTVKHKKTGLLYRSNSRLESCIIKLLKDESLNNEYGENAAEYAKAFMPEKIICKWRQLFQDVLADKTPTIIMPLQNKLCNLVFLRIVNRKVKQLLKWEYGFSVVALETLGRKWLKR